MYYRTLFIIEKPSLFVVKDISLGLVVKLAEFKTLTEAKKFIDNKRKGV
jgi:hypothetical protein